MAENETSKMLVYDFSLTKQNKPQREVFPQGAQKRGGVMG